MFEEAVTDGVLSALLGKSDGERGGSRMIL